MEWILFWTAAATLLVASLFLLAAVRAPQRELRERTDERLDAAFPATAGGQWRADHRSAANLLALVSRGGELQHALVHLNWDTPALAARAYGAVALTMLAGGAAGFVYGSLGDQAQLRGLALAFFGAAAGYFVAKRVIVGRAKARRERIAAEVPVFAQLLRLLFDAGLSYEGVFRTVERESRVVVPEIATELRRVLRRFDTGMDLDEALLLMAARLDVQELNEVVNLLNQISKLGAGAQAPLRKFIVLTVTMRQTQTREQVNKMSAKMSVVMMLFLFPALLIFLAGPGFLALGGALGTMGK